MKKIPCLWFSLVILLSVNSSFAQKASRFLLHFNCDVIVYGGTASGVMAAYTTAKMGKSVILIEPGHTIGGLTTGGLGYTDIGNKYAIKGLSLDFYRRVGRHY